MNVLQLIPELKLGGAERGTVELAACLVRHRHRAVVISAGGELVEQLTAAGARHYQLPIHRKNPWVFLRMISPVARIIRREKIDVVHARSRIPGLIGFFACRLTGVAFITTCHGYYRKHFFSRAMAWGKRVVVASNSVGRHMIEDFGVPRERIRLIPRGVNLEEFVFRRSSPAGKEEGTFRVGMIGRISPIKGHRYFFEAAARLIRIAPRLKIIMVGDTLTGASEPEPEANPVLGLWRRLHRHILPPAKLHYKQEIELLVKRLGLSSLVEFKGVQRNIPEVLHNLDLLVLASTAEEAFGRVIIEAQACGVPVVATRVGGVTDIVEDGKTGLLVPPEDSRSLAKAMITIYKKPGLASRIADAARKKVEKHFSLERMLEDTLQVYREALTRKNVLVIKLSALGDVILAVPSLRALRARFRKAKITLLVGRTSREVAQRCPYIDEVITFDSRRGEKSFVRTLRAGARLRRGAFDLVIDLQNNRTSHLLGYLSGARERYGYGNGKLSFLLNHRVRESGSILSPARHQLRVLRMIGIDAIDESLALWPNEEDGSFAEAFLAEHWIPSGQKLIGINLGVSQRHPQKRWPVEYYARLADELAEKHHMRVVVTGAASDKEAARQFLQLTGARPVMAVGRTTIHQLAALISRCRIFVTSDSAALHVAATTEVPIIALFGPTDPRRHLNPRADCTILRRELDCSPCYRSSCRHQRCMREIEVEEVLTNIESFINHHPS